MHLPGKGNLEEAFSAWLLGDVEIPFQLGHAASAVAGHVGGQRRYQDIAVLGFAATCDRLQETHQSALKEGLLWIIGREPSIDGRLQGFCTDAVALLGIVLGARALEDNNIMAQLHEWLNKFMSHTFQTRLHDWQMCLLIGVCQVGGINAQKAVPDANDLADVRVALRSKKILSYDVPTETQDQLATLLLMKRGLGSDNNVSRAALRLAAFQVIQTISSEINLGKPTIEDVSRILHRIPAAFRRWTWEDKARTRGKEARKWYIDNEYHVQNLLYFLLSPIFSDLKDEDYTPSIGQMHPRADLLIPSLSLIIEVKFMRASNKPQDIIEQIAADSNLYLISGSTYKQIIAFIWDNSSQSQEHDYMRNGLKQLPGIVDAIVISRPGNLLE
jgi:hypothetical protein